MLKTYQFLFKTTFFNTFVIFSILMLQGVNAQAEYHGAAFELGKEIAETSKAFEGLKSSETLKTQVKGTIAEVCQAKGCWIKVTLEDDQQVFVKFKDYGFFVPTDSAGKQVVLNGEAFVEEMSVEDQRHYASDKGASAEDIAKITEPKKTWRFEADGVRISDGF